jgi:hypothetical protein
VWYLQFNACDYPELKTMEDYLSARVTKSLRKLEPFNVVAKDHDLKVRATPYTWGDQAAEDYILR